MFEKDFQNENMLMFGDFTGTSIEPMKIFVSNVKSINR